jgi:tetratricopeptide (TPR) repeat protein
MAVLVEGISVIARRDRLDELFPGGSEQYIADCPNATACADNYLVRIGFMGPDGVRGLVRRLESLGFVHLDAEGNAQDLVVVDQLRGSMSKCDWIEYGQVEIGGNRVAIARLAGDPAARMIAPPGWTYEESLTHKHRFVPLEQANSSLKFLHYKDGMHIYFDPTSHQRFYSPQPPTSDQVRDLAAVVELMNAEQDKLAYERAKTAIELDPMLAAGWAMAGACLRSLGRLDEAKASLSRAVQLGCGDVPTLLSLAKCYQDMGDVGTARTLYEQIVANARDAYPALHELAVLDLQAGEYRRAAEKAERALQAFARDALRQLSATNRFENARAPAPTLATTAWSEMACYAVTYSTAAEPGVGAFVVPTPESARAETQSGEHGGLYWFDATDADGVRSRNFLPNFFNAFFQRCLSNPLYPVMLTVRGHALQSLGDGAAEALLAEAAALTQS